MNEYLSVSSLRSWRNCFCACEIFGDEALFSRVCLEKRAPKRLLHIRRTALELLFRNFPCANNSARYLSLSVSFCFYVFQVEMVAGKNARGVKLSASVSPHLTCRSSVWQDNAGGLFGDQHLTAWAAVVLISSVLTVWIVIIAAGALNRESRE